MHASNSRERGSRLNAENQQPREPRRLAGLLIRAEPYQSSFRTVPMPRLLVNSDLPLVPRMSR
jgi:hypothetical protein